MVGNAGLGEHYPTIHAGVLPPSWTAPGRAGARYLLDGKYVDVRALDTVATLRSLFGALAADTGLPDLGAR